VIKNSAGCIQPIPVPAPRLRTVVNVATGNVQTGLRIGLAGSRNYIDVTTGAPFPGSR
jgi:hypothetical protein